MNIENAKLRLSDSEEELSYSQRLAIHDLLEQLQTDKLEMAKAIVIGHITDDFKCHYCDNYVDMNFNGHDYNCIVTKAQKCIKEVEK